MNLQNFRTNFARANFVDKGKVALEWIIIAAWSLWLGRDYLNLSLNMWPSGGQEYIMSMQNQYVWTLLQKCGSCFFWNGFTNGGAPSFIDLHGSWLHPIVILTTFLFGVFNSGKIIAIASLFMAGMGQWLLGKVLKLGTITRLWTSLLMVASGALAGRMQIASIPLILSTAACCLVFPIVLQLALYGGKKVAIALGITLGLAVLSGQGYLQIGLAFSLLPILVVLLVENNADGTFKVKPQWRYFLFAVILGALIAAPLLVPVGHLSSILNKNLDATFASAQPLEFNPLNLVINNAKFYLSDVLGKQPYPYLYVNFIGWIPVIFAILGMSFAPRESRKVILAIALAIVFVYLASSANILKWISAMPFGSFMTGIRNPGPIQGLAVPLILVLAGIGVEGLIKKEWPQVGFSIFKTDQKVGGMTLSVKWITMCLLMGVALFSAADFSKSWLYVSKYDEDTNSLIQSLKTPDAQWVQPPFGKYFWLPAAVQNGLKIKEFFRPWGLTGSVLPKAYLEMSGVKDDAKLPEYIGADGDYVLLQRPESLYAYVTDNDQQVEPCTATSTGGFVDVVCDTTTPGKLTVMENAVNGWTVALDGKATSLIAEQWLTVDAPQGKHNYTFRYQPWDVPLGIGLAVLGWAIAIIGLFYYARKERNLSSDTTIQDA